MRGAAERAIHTRRRSVVESVGQLGLQSTPFYESSSAFTFVYDSSVSRDVADVSAVSQELSSLLSAAGEQSIEAPSVDLFVSDRDKNMARSNGANLSAQRSVNDLAAMLTIPSTLAGNEKAELACRAMGRGWTFEASRLFLQGAELVPTEPFFWFGAGLCGYSEDPNAASDHFLAAAKFLRPTDPPGAAYCLILAAATKERGGGSGQARQLLEQNHAELGSDCPAIGLHLARLGSTTEPHVAIALRSDPLLQTDVLALGLRVDPREIEDRRSRTEAEINILDRWLPDLIKVDSGSGRARSVELAVPADEPLALAILESRLWAKINQSNEAMSLASDRLDERTLTRQIDEQQLIDVKDRANLDLDHETAITFFLVNFVLAIGIFSAVVAGTLFARLVPSVSWLLMSVAWLVVVLLLGIAVRRFWLLMWPRRHYTKARKAIEDLPFLAEGVAHRRDEELQASQRFDKAKREIELQTQRMLLSRSFVVPRRPQFGEAEAES